MMRKRRDFEALNRLRFHLEVDLARLDEHVLDPVDDRVEVLAVIVPVSLTASTSSGF